MSLLDTREACLRHLYAQAAPDTRGVWAHWPTWDVWEVATSGRWSHDPLNPECWVLPTVPAAEVRLYGTFGEA